MGSLVNNTVEVEYKGDCNWGLRSKLLLENGLLIEACGFGSPDVRVGELVFTTGMVGYPETLTDPSYEGQILIITHPLVGNYGVPSRDIVGDQIPLHYESDRIHVEALVVSYVTRPNHWSSIMSIHEWLESENIPGLLNVDTRMLVKHIREKGVMMAVVAVYPKDENVDNEYLKELLAKSGRYDSLELVSKVSPKKPIVHVPSKGYDNTIVLVDCGVKYGILRELLARRFRVVRIPYDHNPIDYLYEYNAKGVVYSNGPGNPELLEDTIDYAREVIRCGIPTLGICLGHQILALASGAKTFKLKYGHRGQNKPCINVENNECFVTSQNHGYAVDERSLEGTGFKVWMLNIDDKTVEGLKHTGKPVITVQFHPEGSPGPLDTMWIFDKFKSMVEKYGVSI